MVHGSWDILKRNGSAVDAAIAALLCVSLVNAQSMGIGGGGVFTIWDASTGKVETINARETAPMDASEKMFGKDPKKAKPGLFIAVPGELRGYELAHKRHGRLKWKELFEPSIKLAREGFKIDKPLAKAINETSDTILTNAALCEVFCGSHNKTLLKEKDTIRFLKLADTYEKIAEQGPDAFYDGSLTQDILDDIKAAGGIVTREDLKNYKPVLNESAINFTVGNYIFRAPDAPFGGPVLALILNILKGYNISSSSVSTTENKTLTYHRMIEAFRFANVQKGKRPLSSMCPTIILDKHSKVKMVVGGAGGTNITTSVAQVILNYLFFDYDMQKALEEPKVQITINEANVDERFEKPPKLRLYVCVPLLPYAVLFEFRCEAALLTIEWSTPQERRV
ncbi:gamma-glutamyltranspeptidase 1-like protein [Labeo rohita]|uniref:Gamma-glutamyltranspeptidase 1-like protein n=1 Tax=Labeo rohita TaxID=84645 RepID=A0A498LW37_LABRO|nr:gamma-glutamyltranspeptidase 1-like protein [Labeo rohita]